MIKYDWKNNSKIKETIKEHLQEGKSYREIADILDTSWNAIESVVKHYNLRAGLEIKAETPKNLAGKTAKALIYLLKEELSKIPHKIEIKHKYPARGDSLVIHFTDWHVGKVIKNEFGEETYNINVFKKRVNKLLGEILILLDNYISKGTPINDVVIICTGDILDGMGIYASQAVNSELSPPFQVVLAAEIIRGFILALLKRKLPIRFFGVKGNHGEIRGEGGKAKDPNANWDMMLFLMLEWWAKDNMKDKKIQINYSELDYMNLEIQGWRYNIRHIAPLQAETPAGKAKFLGWAKKHKIQAVVYGHYHHWMLVDRSGITVFRGGSLSGQDDLSEQMAEESDAVQLIWGVSAHRPLSFAYPVDLGGK